MQMDAGMTTHVVRLAWIGEEIGLCASLDTGIEERQTVLRHYRRIVIARDDPEQVFTCISALVERVFITLPHAHVIVASTYLGWIPSFISSLPFQKEVRMIQKIGAFCKCRFSVFFAPRQSGRRTTASC